MRIRILSNAYYVHTATKRHFYVCKLHFRPEGATSWFFLYIFGSGCARIKTYLKHQMRSEHKEEDIKWILEE